MKSTGIIVEFVRKHATDVVIACAFFCLASSSSLVRSSLVGDAMLTRQEYQDSWFDSDMDGYYRCALNRVSPQQVRTGKHPLILLVLYSPVRILRLAGLEPATAIRLYIAASAGLWAAMFYAFLRMLGCLRTDAILFTLLGLGSAAVIFGFVGPETYPFSALSILAAAMITQAAQHRRVSPGYFVALDATTFGITVTNGFAGILATVLGNPLKKLLPIFGSAFLLVVILAAAQKAIFPAAVFPPLNLDADVISSEKGYLLSPDAGGPENVLVSALSHSVVMPAIQRRPHPRTARPMLRTQFSAPGSGSPWGAAALVLWAIVFGTGLWAFIRSGQQTKVRLFIGAMLIGQLALHLVYTGRETFLYALHFAPLLVATAAFGTLGPHRARVRFLAGALLICLLVNNLLMFADARKFYRSPVPASEMAP